MADSKLLEYVLHGREERNLEYKGSINWKDVEVKVKITKAILGMANIIDGGTIVIGVEQEGEKFTPKGLSDEEFESFKQDDIAEHVGNFSEPFVEIKVTGVKDDNRKFVFIQIKEFSETPIICKRDSEAGGVRLREGAIYTRPYTKTETSEVRTYFEMREITESAADKNMRTLFSRMKRVNISELIITEATDESRFDEQLDGL